MHLIFVNQYYPPDVAPTGAMLREVANWLVGAGHEVTVVCSAGGYGGGEQRAESREQRIEEGGVRVMRVGATRFGRGSLTGKLVDYASFYVSAFFAVLRVGSSGCRVVAMTTPPFLSVLARVASKLCGGRHAHWVMDLYPDVMVAHGMLREGGFAQRLLDYLAGWGFGGSRSVGVLSIGPDMDARISRFNVRHDWVPLWGSKGHATTSDAQRLREERGWKGGDLVVMYSGNMGLGHEFGTLLAANMRDELGEVRFVFYGDGKRKIEVEDFVENHPEATVELHGYVDGENLDTHLMSADVHVVSLLPGWTGVMVPSKMQGIFAVGRPVVFVGDQASSIGQWISEANAGWVVDPGDVDQMVCALSEAKDVARRAEMAMRAREFAKLRFDREQNVRRVAEFFAEKITS